MLHPDKLPRSEFFWCGLALELGKHRVLILVADAIYPESLSHQLPRRLDQRACKPDASERCCIRSRALFAEHGEGCRGGLQPRKDGGLMEDPEDSFSFARHLLLEVMAEQEGCSLSDAVLTYNRNAAFKHRINIAAMNMTAAVSYAIH
jgi:hypothetical protein